jgi:hypothetical protein
VARRAPWGARKRLRSGSANDTRLAPPACSEPVERARIDIRIPQGQLSGLGRHVPRRDRILPKEVRWRGSKCVSRVLAPLVPDGAAPRTQESHPSTLDGLGTHNERFNLRFPLDATPLGGNHLTSGLGTATTCAPSVSGVTGWVLAARRAPPNARARTGSICVRVALRRGGPCGAPEPLGAPCEPGTCPLCTPSEGGRSTGCAATAHAHEDPAPSTGRTCAGAHCTPARASR